MTDDYPNLVRRGVLPAIDLILFNERNEILVGRRRNAPARGLLFVPGGSVRKGERMAEALGRIARQELGLEIRPEELVLQGLYDHLYPDSAFDAHTPTQYAVMACRGPIRSDAPLRPDEQHEALFFLPIAELLRSPEVHPHTKNYFRERPENLFLAAAPPLLASAR